ncbi:hypothetical protein DACRYDRAFT_21588 [Dacryopinax primogenitus]|uniref:Uncharacterized protein n=1 Tax=Dacryopinax primogenitus (strain DJM 731) TaxID=1858805 RepID=M5G591_DACPD|nr:uncharacterized protein DACRYDRAFT_21588 [Dacryopinax primogenitus]EJU03400.1 hypothetical protein DACRYDRAFT_21588 [Dacryopinax primogenitus]
MSLENSWYGKIDHLLPGGIGKQALHEARYRKFAISSGSIAGENNKEFSHPLPSFTHTDPGRVINKNTAERLLKFLRIAGLVP